MYFHWQLLLLFSITASVTPAPTSSAPPPQSTACGDIVNSDDTSIFNASLIYECLTSVPFNPAVATRFLEYYNDTLQFQSTLSYLKNPPSSYQQPSVDLLGGLVELQDGIDKGDFPNQYEFEAALARLLYAAHDGHLTLFAGILAAFSFGSPYDIVSLSPDGVQLPKVYLAVDLDRSNSFVSYTPSPIASINGVDTTTYLTDFASNNSYGTLEPHSDYNQLMLSAAQNIQNYFSIFGGGATFYPGDNINFKLENGTEIDDFFLGVYYDQGPVGPLETGGDFYNSFVLGFYPASFDGDLIDNNTVNITAADADDDSDDDDSDSSDASATSATASFSAAASTLSAAAPTSTSSSMTCTESWMNSAYPDCPDVAQLNLGIDGVVSGYFLNSTSLSVLSIPSFVADDDAIGTFQSTVTDFIQQSQDAKLSKIVIDLQSNSGGQPLLAIDTFKQFFPNIDPFGGSRMRATPAGNIMGQTITTIAQNVMGLAITDIFQGVNLTDHHLQASDEWAASERVDADTNRLFTSWKEFFGPHPYNGDQFTTTQRYDLSNADFVQASVGSPNNTFAIHGYGADSSTAEDTPPFAAEDIIILSDGICSSACALFMEMMHHEAGVRVVVAGGRPVTGPMQSPSGTRGATVYTTDDLDSDIDLAQTVLAEQNSPEASFLPNRTEALDVYVLFASVNLRDQIRKNETIPLQFAYEAADCRIFYTPQTIFNYTALWQYAADAIWTKPSLCVEGSTGLATTGMNQTDFVGPSPSSSPGTFSTSNMTSYLGESSPAFNDDGIEAVGPSNVGPIQKCKTNDDCLDDNGSFQDLVCVSTTACQAVVKQCLPLCDLDVAKCKANGGAGTCRSNLDLCSASANGGTTCAPDGKSVVCVPNLCSRLLKGNVKTGAAPPKTLQLSKKATNLGSLRG